MPGKKLGGLLNNPLGKQSKIQIKMPTRHSLTKRKQLHPISTIQTLGAISIQPDH